MRLICGIVATLCGTLVVFSFAGMAHPAGDSFAVIRWPLTIVFIGAVAFAPIFGWIRCVFVVAGLGVLVQIFGPRWLPEAASDYDFVMYQQNLLYARETHDPWVAAVRATGPDFVTLQEVSGRNKVVLDALSDVLPTQVYCEFATVGGVAVLSGFHAVQGSATCADRDGLAAVQLETAHGRIWLVSVHLHWPWPYGQAAQVDRLVDLLERLDGHVVIGGDFNAVAWSHTLRRFEQASGTRIAGPDAPTFAVRGYPIGIDHILTGPAYAQQVDVMPKLGSDHHGVRAYLTRPSDP